MQIGDLVCIKLDALIAAVKYQTRLSEVDRTKILESAKLPQVIKSTTLVGAMVYYDIEINKNKYLFMESELVSINGGV